MKKFFGALSLLILMLAMSSAAQAYTDGPMQTKTAAAADMTVAVDCGRVFVSDIDSNVAWVAVSGCDEYGKTVYGDLQAADGGEAVLDFYSSDSLTLFCLDDDFCPMTTPQEVELTQASRVWLCEQICRACGIDLEEYDPDDITFSDCDALSDTQKQAVLAVSERRWVLSYSDNTFCPNNSLTRAEAATILCRVLGLSDVPSVTLPYGDVSDNNWFVDYVKELYDLGIPAESDRFCPYDPLYQSTLLRWLSGYSCIMNLHFEVRGDVAYLAWDCIGESGGSRFRITPMSAQGETDFKGGTGEHRWRIPADFEEGTYTRFRVEMIYAGNTVASAEEDLTLTVTNGGTKSTASAAFYKLTTSVYLIEVSGIGTMPSYDVRMENQSKSSRAGFYGITARGGSAVVFYDDDEVVNGADYTICGVDRCTLTSRTSLSCRKTVLHEKSAITVKSYPIGNIRFAENGNGLPILMWDAPRAGGIRFEVYTTANGGMQYACQIGGSSRTGMPMAIEQSGTYSGICVVAKLDGVEIGRAANDNLSVVVNTSSQFSSGVDADIAKIRNGRYEVELSGMSGYDVYSVMFSRNQGGGGECIGNFGDVCADSFLIYFDDNGTYCENGYYTVWGGKNYVLSAGDTVLTCDMVQLKDWTAAS